MSKATEAAKPATTGPVIKPEIIAGAAKHNFTIDHKTGVATSNAAELYVAGLPATVTVESIKDLHAYNTNFVAEHGLGLTDAGVGLMKKHPDLAQIESEFQDPAGNKFSVVLQRSKLSGPPGGEKTEKFGVLNASIELRAARKTGQFGAVKAYASAQATKLLASK